MFQRSKKWLSATLLLLSTLLSNQAFATQYVDGCEKSHVQVNFSANEQNRLAIDGRRIGTVVPSQKGALAYAKDEATGSLYFTKADEGSSGTITLFVSDEQNPQVVCKLILVPRPIAGEEIIIRLPIERVGGSSSARHNGDGRATSYQRQAKNLILNMADEEGRDVEAVAVNQEIPLWKEGRLVLLSKYLDGGLVGEKYRLTNVSNSEMLLVEQELFRKGVVVVVIENHTLMPTDSTYIFIVRGRKDNE